MPNYDKNNLFAKILRGEIPCQKVYEDEAALAFYDIHPVKKVHILVIPKGAYVSFDDFTAQASTEEQIGFYKAVQTVAAQVGVSASGYRLVANHGADGGQEVPHYHVHILGGEPVGRLGA